MKTFDYELVKNPEYFKENCVQAHSSHKYFESIEAMECGEEQFQYSLNGLWKFQCKKLQIYHYRI